MSDFFGYQNDDYFFHYFSFPHLLPIIVMFFIIFLLFIFKNHIRNYKYEEKLRYIIGSMIIFTQMAYTYNNVYISESTSMQFATITKDLPLSLCGASMILSGFMLFIKSKKLFNILYFWVMIGALLAILLPSAIANDTYGHYGPDKFRYYQFWIGHIGIILIIFYMIFIHKFTITLSSTIYSFIWLMAFGVFVLFINISIKSNYLFINNPDDTGLTFFPPYPYSVPFFILLAVILYTLAYLPWFYINKRKIMGVKIK